MRQQLSLTAGRVLGCALDAREAGGLSPDLFKLFLVGCAEEAEISSNDPDKTAGIMRTILNRQPRFTPAWARLVVASGNAVAVAEVTGSGAGDARETLAQDIRRAREIAPDLPEIKVAEIELLSPYDYAGALQRLAQAKALAPNKADIWLGEPWPLMRVGRMSDAIESAQRAAELDPLSPAATRERIMTLAYGGRIELAQRELQHAERRWAGTDALRDAQWAFHLRFGDPEIARTVRPGADADLYFQARLNPTPENVNAAVADIQAFMSEMESGNQMDSGGAFGAIQVLGEFHRTEEALEWLDHFPSATVARHSYLLFRPAFADIRRDPRFMVVAKRIGLLNYWRNSGKWPDFCSEPQLPYDCKEEATKLAA